MRSLDRTNDRLSSHEPHSSDNLPDVLLRQILSFYMTPIISQVLYCISVDIVNTVRNIPYFRMKDYSYALP